MTSDVIKRDIEETDELLDAPDETPIGFWVKKQRELVTSVVDYNLGTLADLVDDRIIELSPRYQRRFRWDTKRQSLLIESFLMNVPVPPIFLNEDEYGKYSVIDGKQRLTAITDFVRGRYSLDGLSIFSDLNTKDINDLPSSLKNVLKTRPTLRAIIILRQSDQDVKFEVFRRLNTGGVKLNAQEIRNSAFPGPLNDLILDLSENAHFHKLLGIKNKKKSAIYQEMRDAEFVLRFFTFRDSWKTFRGGMKREMDVFMQNNRNLPKDRLDELRHEFLSTIEKVDLCFSGNAFQRWQPEKNSWRKQVLASVFDAQMFACRTVDLNQINGKHEKIISKLKSLFGEKEFRNAIDAATNTPSYFRLRINSMVEMLNEAIR